MSCITYIFDPSKCAFRALNKGVVLTSAPLKRGTLFEVVIDKKQGPTPRLPNSNSIEIGITCNDPSTLRLPDTMTNLTFGQNWMVSGSSVAYNGKKVQNFAKTNLNQLEVGILDVPIYFSLMNA